jgi:hypothetical protein
MMFGHQKRLNFGPDLSGQILSRFLRHTVEVVFETAAEQQLFDQLITWCDHHCRDVFAASKQTPGSAMFRFFSNRDFAAFQACLAAIQESK